MTSQNLISATIKPADKAAILQMIADIKSRMDYLLTLQTKEVQALYKLGNSYQPFLEKAYSTSLAHPQILPSVFDSYEFKKDYDFVKEFADIADQIKQLSNTVQNTMMAAKSDALYNALGVYSAVKLNRKAVPGLNVVADEMAAFFKKGKRKASTTTVATA